MMIDALQVLGGAAAGYLTAWWMNNRKKIVDNLSEEIQDAIDHLEDATGLDVPDSLEEKIEEVVEAVVDRVEDVVEEAAEVVSEAVEEGDLSEVTEDLSEVVAEAVDEAKAELDVALDDLEDLTVAGLKERLVELGLPTKGRKADLIARITEYVEGSQ
jgi:CO dehydrogenase/acetyl-CoA synthase beta subunit